MKKIFALLSMVMLAATLSFASTINYYNQTSNNVQFLRDGNPVGYSTIPNGFYTETVPMGSYHLAATNGQDTTGGYDCTLDSPTDTCNYRVFEQDSSNANPDLDLVLASYTQYDGFAVDAPIPLVTTGPAPSTTHAKIAFTQTLYTGTMPNSDVYMASVAVYPFAVEDADLDRATNGFIQRVNGTVRLQRHITISGLPALMSSIISKDDTGRDIGFALLVTYKGNRSYMFGFASYVDVTSNETEFKEFFNSISIN
jgi:hypothetical protein